MKASTLILGCLAGAMAAATAALFVYDGRRGGLSVAYAAFVAGCAWQLYRLTGDWRKVAGVFAAAVALAWTAVLPGRHETSYVFAEHAALVPVAFAFILLLGAIVVLARRLAEPLSAGSALLHSLALTYWVAAVAGVGWTACVCADATLAVLAVAVLRGGALSRRERLGLSVWNTVTMCVFSLIFAANVALLGGVESAWVDGHRWRAGYALLEYFLLGCAGPYVLYNALLLVGFLDLGKKGAKTHKEVDRVEISRFDPRRPSKRAALVVTLATSAVFALNLRLGTLPPSLAVWAALLLAPAAASLLEAA